VAENLRLVGISEMVISADPEDVLVAYGLGSCVAICLYDPQVRVGGMLHALLPTLDKNNNIAHTSTKFVDQGVPLLVNALVALRAKPTRLIAYLCGGACVLTKPSFNGMLNTGELNVQAARKALQAANLKIRGEATGEYKGRTVRLYLVNGQVTVKTLGQPERVLGIER
jgi:chemotaxis protein CheD